MANMDSVVKRSSAMRWLAVGTATLVLPQASITTGERESWMWQYGGIDFSAPIAIVSQHVDTIYFTGSSETTVTWSGSQHTALRWHGTSETGVSFTGRT